MQIKEIIISNYRGIKKLSKSFDQNFICLIGPGDSAKTTVLNAIEILFYPSWRLNTDDSDFFNHNLDDPIEITATITNFPEEFLNDNKYGLFTRGWNSGIINDEPQEDDKIALTVRLSINKNLEPEWRIVNDREPEGIKFSQNDRAKLKVLKIGDYIERQFYWRQGTILNQLTDDSRDANSIILEANRKTRIETTFRDDPSLEELLNSVLDNAKKYGVNIKNDNLEASLDSKYLQKNLGIVGLHDGNIPLRLKGLSTKRLFLISLQLLSIESGTTILVDEIELGFEPHRLRNILRKLKNLLGDKSQIFITTHSPITTVELTTNDIFITRSSEGDVSLSEVNSDLQGTIRSSPEALFGRKVIVCEGPTEIGICRAIDSQYQDSKDSFSYLGINLVDGGGSSSTERALHFNELGFDTTLFIDSDDLNSFNPSLERLETNNIEIIHWPDQVCTEERIIKDLDLSRIDTLLELALELNDYSEEQIVQSFTSRLPEEINIKAISDVSNYSNSDKAPLIIESISQTIVAKSLFKRISKGEKLGTYILNNVEYFENSATLNTLNKIKNTLYGE